MWKSGEQFWCDQDSSVTIFDDRCTALQFVQSFEGRRIFLERWLTAYGPLDCLLFRKGSVLLIFILDFTFRGIFSIFYSFKWRLTFNGNGLGKDSSPNPSLQRSFLDSLGTPSLLFLLRLSWLLFKNGPDLKINRNRTEGTKISSGTVFVFLLLGIGIRLLNKGDQRLPLLVGVIIKV